MMGGFNKTILIILIITAFIGCKKEAPPTLPFFHIKNVYAGGIICYCTISSNGGDDVIERGFMWKTEKDADYKNEKIAFDNTNNYFETTIFGLLPNTTYYVKAYATNSEGTGYSSEKQITTSMVGTLTDSRDGNTYKWVEIGNQIWMAENLAYLPYISPFTNDTGIFVYNYKGSYVDEAKSKDEFKTYGCLYTWEISLKVCPDGWHLPSEGEWQELERFIGMTSLQISQFLEYDNTFASIRIKSTDWTNLNGTPQPNNVTLFSAMPAGYHYHEYSNYGLYYDTYFNGLGVGTNFWSSTKNLSDDFVYEMRLDYNGISNYVTSNDHGYSVRCVKD